jgi:cyclic pyranopterin phosphate synthase
MVEIEFARTRELRLLVTSQCQLKCSFCHNEGQPGSQNTWQDRTSFTAAHQRVPFMGVGTINTMVVPLAKALGAEAVHLTGGEPTLHPRIVDLLDACNKHFRRIKITTNGVLSETLLRQIAYRVSAIIFSIHATSNSKFREVQGQHLSSEVASVYFHNQMASLHLARKWGVPVSINSVVLDKETTLENIRLADEIDVPIRLLRDLGNPRASEQILQEIIIEGCFRIEGLQLGRADSSGYRETYSNGKLRFTLKRIQEIYLDGMCNECPIIEQCRECFYGVRVEPDGRIRLCIHRNDPMTLMPLALFLNGPLYPAVLRAYEAGEPK